jgi:4a-hydroxytetrahydrobiopterin dehydratase
MSAMTSSLATKHCVPCEAGTPPLARADAEGLLPGVPGWRLIEGEPLKIERSFKHKDFVGAMAFVNTVAAIAEAEGHHPDIHISWNRVRFELFTHAIGGLSENDFILAAKINEAKEGGERHDTS